jgi:hypothetical protein
MSTSLSHQNQSLPCLTVCTGETRMDGKLVSVDLGEKGQREILSLSMRIYHPKTSGFTILGGRCPWK